MLSDWRFSWRGIGAALSAAALCGVGFGLTMSLLDLSVSPEEASSFLFQAGVLALASAIVLALFGGALLLIVSLASRLMPWPRPWVEAIVAGAALFAVVAGGDLLSFTFTTDQGALPANHPVTVFGAKIAPVAFAALFPIVYWLLARPAAGKA